MSPLRTLRARLLASHLAVVAVGIGVLALTAGPLVERFFHAHLQRMAVGSMSGMGATMMGPVEEGLAAAFRSAMLLALAAGIVTAIVAAVVASRRIVAPIDRMRVAARGLAAGDYRRRVPIPPEAELAALAEDVNTLAEALETTEARRLQLINEVAHELRTPLATIQGYMEGLSDGVFEPNPEIFDKTAREARRLAHLAADLSTLSRAEEGGLRLRRDPVDLARVVDDVAAGFRPLFFDDGVELVVETPAGVVVPGDVDRLTQVVVNLLGNALEHTDPGGRVTVTVRREEARAVVEISDDGEGIPAEELERIFERFHRVDPDRPGGTGIGLTVARSIVRLHGGSITASSPGLGSGATFTVELPVASA